MHPHMEKYYQIVMTKTCSMKPIWSEQIDHDDHYCADMITLRKGTFKEHDCIGQWLNCWRPSCSEVG